MPREKAKGFGQFRGSVSNNALFGVSDDLPRVIEVELDRIQTNPDQPRKHFDPDKLQELADSIRDNGLIQPITVAEGASPGTYLVVAGERRLRAHQLLERTTIPAILTTGDPDVLALIENIQREQLDPLEEADAYAQMIERHGYSQEELGRVVGKKQNTISEALSLRSLSPTLVAEYRTSDKTLSKSVLIEIAKEQDDGEQRALLQEALDYRLGVRAVRERRQAPSPASAVPGAGATDAVRAANARKDRLIRSLAVALKRVREDARAEDFPAGSEALSRLQEIKAELDEALSPVFKQGRLTAE